MSSRRLHEGQTPSGACAFRSIRRPPSIGMRQTPQRFSVKTPTATPRARRRLLVEFDDLGRHARHDLASSLLKAGDLLFQRASSFLKDSTATSSAFAISSSVKAI